MVGDERYKEIFDPSEVIELVKEQYPERPEIATALQDCTSGWWETSSHAYIWFIWTDNPNERASEWQFDENIIVNNGMEEYVLDVLADGLIGGIEFKSNILKNN